MRSKRGLGLLRPVNEKYLLRDEFRGARAAGAVDGTAAEPGPGTRAVVDTNTVASVTGGDLSFPQGADFGDPGVVYGDIPVTRVAGRMLIADLLTPGQYPRLIWNGSPSITATAQWKQSIGFFTNVVQSYGSEGALVVGTVTDSVRYTVWLILRANGYFAFIKGGTEYPHPTLLFPFSAGSDATLYACLAGSSAIGTRLMSFIRIPERLLLPNPFAYDTFVRANGAPGSSEAVGPDGQPVVQRAWLGAGLAIDTNELKNTPTVVDDERVNNPGFEGAYEDEGGGLMLAPNWNGYILDAGTDTATKEESHVHGGAAAQKVTANETLEGVFNITSNLTLGTWYQASVWVDTTMQVWLHEVSGNLQIDPNPVLPDTSGVYAQLLATFRAIAAGFNLAILLDQDGAATIYYDDASVKPLTLSTLFGSLQTATPDVVIDAKVAALTTATQAGIVARLDSDTNPQNLIIAYLDGVNARLEEMASGTWQATILDVAQAFTADDTLRLDLSGTAYRLYHITDAGVATLLGSGTVTVTTGSKHGVFSTYAANRVDIVNVMPKGTAGEYEWLSKY